MPNRNELKNRRQCDTLKMVWQISGPLGETYFVNVWRRDDGKIFDVRITQSWPSSIEAPGVIHDASIIISIALQNGISVPELRNNVSRLSSGSPASFIGAVLDIISESYIEYAE